MSDWNWNDDLDDEDYDDEEDDLFEDEDVDDDDDDDPLVFVLSANDDGAKSLTIVDEDGSPLVLDEDDDLFLALAAACVAGDKDEVANLLAGGETKSQRAYAAAFQRLDERVTLEDGVVHFDGKPTHTAVTRTIQRYLAEGRDTTGLVKFMEKLDDNPSRHSRDQLWNWVEKQSLAVTPEGDILGFKSIREDGLSHHAGTDTVYVDGVEHTGRIPNTVGAVISMNRRDVDDDFSNDCSYGLHVGTHHYASTFGSAGSVLVEVKFSPADAVSVPQYDHSKIRVCEYQVIAVHLPEVGDDLSHLEAEINQEAQAEVDDAAQLAEAFDALAEDNPALAQKVGFLKRALNLLTRS